MLFAKHIAIVDQRSEVAAAVACVLKPVRCAGHVLRRHRHDGTRSSTTPSTNGRPARTPNGAAYRRLAEKARPGEQVHPRKHEARVPPLARRTQ